MPATTHLAGDTIEIAATLPAGRKMYTASCPICEFPAYFKTDLSRSAKRTCTQCKSECRWTPNSFNDMHDEARRITFRTRIVKIGERWTGTPVTDGEMVPAALVEKMVNAAIEKALAEKIVDAQPRIVIQSMKPLDIDEIKVEGRRHPKYRKIVAKVQSCRQIILVGPAGTGKSTLPKLFAQDFELQYGEISCTDGLSEVHLLGRRKVEMTGVVVTDDEGNEQQAYIPSRLVQILENGGVFLFDEIDAADANTLLVLNALFASHQISLPNRPEDPIVKMHEDCYLFAAANTFGTGSDMVYVGRNQLDGAFLDRFVCLFEEIDYDIELENQIAREYGITGLVPALRKIRENVARAKIRRVVSTRAFINAGKLHHDHPELFPISEMLNEFFAGWADTDRAKAMAGVPLPSDDAIDGDEGIENVVGSDGGETQPQCPRCGAGMVRRRAARGRRAGREFWGCSKWRREGGCTGTVNIDE